MSVIYVSITAVSTSVFKIKVNRNCEQYFILKLDV
jgi:hypothetical protein